MEGVEYNVNKLDVFIIILLGLDVLLASTSHDQCLSQMMLSIDENCLSVCLPFFLPDSFSCKKYIYTDKNVEEEEISLMPKENLDNWVVVMVAILMR